MSLDSLIRHALQQPEHSLLARKVYEEQEAHIAAFQKQRSACVSDAASQIIQHIAKQRAHQGKMNWDQFFTIANRASDCPFGLLLQVDPPEIMQSVASAMGPKFVYDLKQNATNSGVGWKIEK